MASGSPTTICLDVGYEPEFCKYICLLSIKTKRTLVKKVVGFHKNHPAFEIPTNFVGTKLSV